MSQLTQEFIEAAARTLWYVPQESDLCVGADCRKPRSHDVHRSSELYRGGVLYLDPHAFVSPWPIPMRFLIPVAIWTGNLEAVNGCKLPEIAKAASEAEAAACPNSETVEPAISHIRCSLCALDLSAFAAALITEGIWKGRGETSGPSWFDEHTPFTLGAFRLNVGPVCASVRATNGVVCVLNPHDGRHVGCGLSWADDESEPRRFIIPPFEFTYEEKR